MAFSGQYVHGFGLPTPPPPRPPVATAVTAAVTAAVDAQISPPPRASVRFPAFPNDVFFYSVTTDKLETFVTIESKFSKDQWECRVNDERLKKCGPADVEIPRSVIALLLSETLGKMADGQVAEKKPAGNGHSAELRALPGERDLQLVLSLDFGAGWCPVYKLKMETKEVATEDRLRAQIVDLQEEMAQMRSRMKKMEEQLAQATSARAVFR